VCSVAMYQYRDVMYTGTAMQPDVLTMFIKKEHDERPRMQYMEPTANVMGKWVPVVGSVIGVARVVNAVKAIFQCAFSKDQLPKGALLNGFKNLVRGIVEMIPGAGLSLVMFDTLRNHFFFSSNIEKQVAKQQNIAGIAMDGRVICTIDLALLQRVKQSHPKWEELDFFRAATLNFLKEVEKDEDCLLKMPEIFSVIKAGFEKYQPKVVQTG